MLKLYLVFFLVKLEWKPIEQCCATGWGVWGGPAIVIAFQQVLIRSLVTELNSQVLPSVLWCCLSSNFKYDNTILLWWLGTESFHTTAERQLKVLEERSLHHLLWLAVVFPSQGHASHSETDSDWQPHVEPGIKDIKCHNKMPPVYKHTNEYNPKYYTDLKNNFIIENAHFCLFL